MRGISYWALAALACVCSDAWSTQAAVLLWVDTSNPSAVTFTASSNFSQVNDSSTIVSDGVDLLGFFTSSVTQFEIPVSGNLTPTGASVGYSYQFPDSSSATRRDLNLYRYDYVDQTQAFSTLSRAFTGVATSNMASYGSLPAAGASGNIMVGFSGWGSHAIIGQWQVVPEPGTVSILAAGGILMLRRRRVSGSVA